MQTLYLGCDHAALEVKERLKTYLEEKNFQVKDLGTHTSESCHYPDYASAVAKEVSRKSQEGARGILLCGSGIGVSMVANRYQGVRAALCKSLEDARLSREHNNSNIICFGARASEYEMIQKMLDVWLETEFSGGRHSERVSLFNNLGEKA